MREVRKWLLNKRACTKVHYCDVVYLSSVEHWKSIGFYPAVRTGSSNTHFLKLFSGGHLPQTSRFRSAKQILVVSSATQVRARILSDRNI